MTKQVIDPGLRRAGRAAAVRLERNGMRVRGRVSLPEITQEEVSSLSGVLGSRWRAPQPGLDATVELAALDRALRESWYGCTLLDLATAVNGAPLVDRAARRDTAAAAREDGWAALRVHPAVDRAPALAAWLDRERATGAALRASEGDPFPLLRAALELVRLLPADPPTSLARFATAHCGGDPHALDRDRPLDSVVWRALAHLDGDAPPAAHPLAHPDGDAPTAAHPPAQPDGDAPTAAHPLAQPDGAAAATPRALAHLDRATASRAGATARRDLYDRWGLACDELSATVLCCGLLPPGLSPLAQSLRLAAAAGEPRVVTLRELAAVRSLACGPLVFTCENPDVVAAVAEALGPACPPLVCSEGWPSTACLRLLRALCAGGATALHHGDMDPDGLRILDRLLTVTRGSPWRMTVADYERHAAGGVATSAGTPTVVRDPRLRAVARAIGSRGRLVREEQTVAALLADLARAPAAAT